MKKIISILTVLCILVSAMPAFAFFATEIAVPELGVLTFHDFENNATGAVASQLQAYSGGKYNITTNPNADMHNANVYVYQEASGNKYTIHAVKGASFLYGIRDRQDSTISNYKEHFETGVLKLSYDVLVPTTTNETFDSNYMYYYTNNKETNGYGYLNQVSSVASEASINFSKVLSYSSRPTDEMVAEGKAIKKVINNNQWYTVTMILDYDNCKVSQYLDGELVASYTVSEENMVKYHGFSLAGLYKGSDKIVDKVVVIAAETDTSKFPKIDNFLVERIASAGITPSVKDVYTNYIDVEFDATLVDDSDLTADKFEVKALDGTDAVTASSISNTNGVYRLTFANNFAANTNYELIINEQLLDKDTDFVMPSGTKVIFSTPATSGTSVKSASFDSDTASNDYPTTATDSSSDKIYVQKYSADDTENSFVTQKAETYKYLTRSSYVKDDVRKYRFMKISGTGDNTYPYLSMVIPFDSGKQISDGIIEVTFDGALQWHTDSKFEVAFGLRDIAHPEKEYDYNKAWGDATQFIGLRKHKSYLSPLVPGAKDYKARPATDNVLKDDINATPSDVKLNLNKYKFIADLDNDNFEIYYNNEKLFKSDYMPGRVNDGVYDAFVITLIAPTPASGENIVYNFDNLIVKHIPSQLEAGSASFAVNGGNVAYNSNVPATANKMTIAMKDAVNAADIANYVTFSGADYAVSAEGKEITLTFPSGLNAGNDYTVTLSKDLAASGSDKVLGADTVLSFKAVSGDVTYTNPVVTVNGKAISSLALKAGDVVNVSVLGKNAGKYTSAIIIAAYKGDTLLDVAFNDAAISNYGHLRFNYTVTEKFAGADAVKVFILDNLSDITPYTANFEISK